MDPLTTETNGFIPHSPRSDDSGNPRPILEHIFFPDENIWISDVLTAGSIVY